jgi:Phosphoserine phosphatase RsbU, N-terminal domain/GAF domain
MSAPGGTESFRTVYASALGDYLLDPSEASLRVAYELGREAVGRELSVLDLAIAHQEALLSVLGGASDEGRVKEIMLAAGDFFLESLSSFEMVRRGFKEARAAFLLERRQTKLSRRLSTFLTDASLALNASDSLQEVLRLVAEQARELAGAECCLATVSLDGQPRTAEAVSHAEPDTRWMTFVRWLDLFEVYELVRLRGGSVRIAGCELARLPLFRISSADRPLQGWLAASLTALDGSELGAIQLFDKQHGNFTQDDEAALVHLAQMASAAVERARLYQNRS